MKMADVWPRSMMVALHGSDHGSLLWRVAGVGSKMRVQRAHPWVWQGWSGEGAEALGMLWERVA